MDAFSWRVSEPIGRSFITVFIRRAIDATRSQTHGSCAFVKKFDNSGFIALITDRQHVVAVRDVEGAPAPTHRRPGLRRPGHAVLGPHGNHDWHGQQGYLLPR